MKIEDGKLIVERSDWSQKQEPPPGERWETIVPVMNLHVEGLHIFGSVSPDDEPPDEWCWLVMISKELPDQKPSKWPELVRVDSVEGFLEEEAIERASRAAEHLCQAVRLMRREAQ